MIKLERCSVMNFENALRGMRHPKESYHLSDTQHGIAFIDSITGGRLSDAIILFENNGFF